VYVSLGCYFIGAVAPHPDPGDPMTILAGIRKRFALKPPRAEPGYLDKFALFVQRFCKKKLKPLLPDVDTSFETWIESTPYPEYRRAELTQINKSVNTIWEDKKYFDCKMFPKDEPHETYKHIRNINSRSDQFKCKVGPIFKLIENEVYMLHHFIKHVPCVKRPDYIYNILYREGAVYYPTDYTAFESLFVAELMESCEFILYDYMTKDLPEHEEFMRLMHEVLAGKFKSINKFFTVEVSATRMSGEMCTSLGNGWTNLMAMLFLCEELGSEVDGVVEGDDGLFSIVGRAPTVKDFAKLGLIIKMETVLNLNHASFCGCVFDIGDRINITDVVYVLITFGWTTQRWSNSREQVLKELLVCKAYSLLFQYRGCPILQSLAMYILRCTGNFEAKVRKSLFYPKKGMNLYERYNSFPVFKEVGITFAKFERLSPIPVPENTRMLVEQLFKVPIYLQLKMENYFDNTNEIKPFSFPELLPFCHDDQIDYYQKYCRSVNMSDIHRQSDFFSCGYEKEFDVKTY
jgi:hypothetical protein